MVTVLVPSLQSFAVGARVKVLIDPQDSGYAEMAGQQFTADSDALLGAAVAWMICGHPRRPGDPDRSRVA
jgi:hypothetical protein